MKHEDLVKRHFPMNLHLFGHDTEDGDDGSGAGGDDQDGSDKPDEDGEGGVDSEESEEKKYSDKDMEAAIQKRIARERRKWQREQRNNSPTGGDEKDGKDKKDQDSEGESEADKKAREAEAKAEALEMKWTCLEHDVKKDCVDDVLALAKVHAAKDSSMDIEDAIDAVLKKYPQFKDGYETGEDGKDNDKKGWGQRHGKTPKKGRTVDDEIRTQLFGE